MTARGGLVLLFEALAARCILVGLPRAGGSPAQGWSDAQKILAVPRRAKSPSVGAFS
ncbi:MAG: hypothetical protein OXI73_10040 [Rhodospirillales bacterium]|nr:hypothetical protein [Rhodospirillales bacterium]